MKEAGQIVPWSGIDAEHAQLSSTRDGAGQACGRGGVRHPVLLFLRRALEIFHNIPGVREWRLLDIRRKFK